MKKYIEEFSLDGFQDSQGQALGAARGQPARAWSMLWLPAASSAMACLLILAAGQIVKTWVGVLGLGLLSLVAFHLVFWSLRNLASERSLKASDYVFLGIMLLGLMFFLNVAEDAWQLMGFILFSVGFALKATKLSAELLSWHTPKPEKLGVRWG